MPGFAALLPAAVTLAMLVWIRPRLRGTTLMAAWVWSVVAIFAVAGTEVLAALTGGSNFGWATLVRYVAAMSTFCPIMAVLGAKRPQDKAWQWVVLCLWVTLCVPVFNWFDVRTAIHGVWLLFVLCLMAVTLLNYMLTPFRLSTVIILFGQWVLLDPYLIDQLPLNRGWHALFALFLFLVASMIAVLWVLPREKARQSRLQDQPLSKLKHRWRTFRNMYGAFWALRVQQRVNQTAEICHWPVSLEWDGFFSRDGEGSPELSSAQIEEINRCLDSLLWRFLPPNQSVSLPDAQAATQSDQAAR